jgi:hypothetical protein
MRCSTFLPVLLAVLLSDGSVLAETIRVTADQPTIQAGIDAASNGDTVLVADGIYTGDGNRDIDFLGKTVVVMSEKGPEHCIIDCQGDESNKHRGFYFHGGEGPGSVLKGFTITGGFKPSGGGIMCSGSSPTIEGNIIRQNTAYDWAGGGIHCYSSSAVITGNVIMGNTADLSGGGITSNWATPTITGNLIMGNEASLVDGGGIDCSFSTVEIMGNTIIGNTADDGGGGITCVEYSSLLIKDNFIAGNSAGFYGGGICAFDSSDVTITGNVIVGNEAGDYSGSGIYLVNIPSAHIVNTTISGNTGTGGGGLFAGYGSAGKVINCILWENSPAQIDGDALEVTYSDVEGGWDGQGNINADPQFVLPEKRDYRLLWGSLCIDSAHPDSLDADGTRRDMGAHFFNQDDYLSLYLTPDKMWTMPGEVLGVTYTAINRWGQAKSFWCLSQVLLSNGRQLNVLGPDQYTLPAHYTAQVHLVHDVPNVAPGGEYEYWSRIGMPPGELYDEDRFTFWVVE